VRALPNLPRVLRESELVVLVNTIRPGAAVLSQ
jgi:hypothetical protein